MQTALSISHRKEKLKFDTQLVLVLGPDILILMQISPARNLLIFVCENLEYSWDCKVFLQAECNQHLMVSVGSDIRLNTLIISIKLRSYYPLHRSVYVQAPYIFCFVLFASHTCCHSKDGLSYSGACYTKRCNYTGILFQ